MLSHNTHRNDQDIIKVVNQSSILGPIFFNLSINELLFFVPYVSLHNFPDDRTLSRNPKWLLIGLKLIKE